MSKLIICRDCGTVGTPKTKTQGHLLIEIILWCCWLIPGLIYTIWRHTTRSKVCSECGSKDIVGRHTPVGQKIAADLRPIC